MNLKRWRKVVSVLLCCIFLGVNPINVCAEEVKSTDYKEFTEVTSENVYGEYQLEWDFNSHSAYDLLSIVSKHGEVVEKYEYNEKFLRIEKESNGIVSTYEYDEDCSLIRANEGEYTLNYYYSFDENDSKYVKGFELNGEQYEFKYENHIIVAILKDDVLIAKYMYGMNYEFVGTYIYKNNEWVKCDDTDFVGNINKVRYVQAYYDTETEWYYMGRYYDPKAVRYIDGISPECAMELIDEYGYRARMKSYTFALPYRGNSNVRVVYEPVELIARIIYAEAGSSSYDWDAVAWVIYNRMLASGNTAVGEVTNGEFTSYIDGRYATILQSEYNEQKFIICVENAELLYNRLTPARTVAYISNQTQFRRVTTFVVDYEGDTGFYVDNSGKYYSFISGDELKIWIVDNVAIPGVKAINNEQDAKSAIVNVHNIYFNVVGVK